MPYLGQAGSGLPHCQIILGYGETSSQLQTMSKTRKSPVDFNTAPRLVPLFRGACQSWQPTREYFFWKIQDVPQVYKY